MERRLRMMVAGSLAVWVPVASSGEARPGVIDLDNAFRLKAAASPAIAAPMAPARDR